MHPAVLTVLPGLVAGLALARIVKVRQACLPVLRSVASIQPRMPYSPPAEPMMPRSRTTSGASVTVSPMAGSATLRSQIFSPVARLSANRRPSSAADMILSFQSATPRLLTPQQATSPAQTRSTSGLNFQRKTPFLPLVTSIA
jgi:hypothetical protein